MGSDLSGSLQGAGGVGGLLLLTDYTGPSPTNYFYGFDGNGNVTALVNASDGTVAARYEYGPFGELIRASGPEAFANPFRFSTKYHDDETGFLYYGYRYYHPGTGRWLNEDPIGERGGMNLFAALNNAPQTYFDPDGQDNEFFCPFPGYSQSVNNAPVNFQFSIIIETKPVSTPPPSYFVAPCSRPPWSQGWSTIQVPTGRVFLQSEALGAHPAAEMAFLIPKAPLGGLAIGALPSKIHEAIDNTDQPLDQKARLHAALALSEAIATIASAGETRLLRVTEISALTKAERTMLQGGRLLTEIGCESRCGANSLSLLADARGLINSPAAKGTPRVLTEAEKKLYERVTYRPKGFDREVWERAKRRDGNVYNPDGRILKYEEPWQFGHRPEHKLPEAQLRAAEQRWTCEEWIRYQSDPDIYRPELPSTNEGHLWENDFDW